MIVPCPVKSCMHLDLDEKGKQKKYILSAELILELTRIILFIYFQSSFYSLCIKSIWFQRVFIKRTCSLMKSILQNFLFLLWIFQHSYTQEANKLMFSSDMATPLINLECFLLPQLSDWLLHFYQKRSCCVW